jgi:hypothetical protein
MNSVIIITIILSTLNGAPVTGAHVTAVPFSGYQKMVGAESSKGTYTLSIPKSLTYGAVKLEITAPGCRSIQKNLYTIPTNPVMITMSKDAEGQGGKNTSVASSSHESVTQKVYQDVTLTAEKTDQWGHPTGLKRKLNIRILGSTPLPESGVLTVELAPGDVSKEWVSSFQASMVCSEGFMDFGPGPRYFVSTDGGDNYIRVVDMSSSERRGYKWAAGLAEIGVGLIPFLGTGYTISKSLESTYNWLKAEEKDWQALWSASAEYDFYSVTKPVLSHPTAWGRKYRIEFPYSKKKAYGDLKFQLSRSSVCPIDGDPFGDRIGFAPQTFQVLQGATERKPLVTVGEKAESKMSVDVDVFNRVTQLEVTSSISTVGRGNMLHIKITPLVPNANEGIRIEEISMALVLPRGTGRVSGIPCYKNYRGKEISWLREKERLEGEMSLSWLTTIVDLSGMVEQFFPKNNAKKIVQFGKVGGDLWSLVNKVDDGISFSEVVSRLWENNRSSNIFSLPTIRNNGGADGQPKRGEGFSADIPLEFTSEKIHGIELLLSASLNVQPYADKDKMFPQIGRKLPFAVALNLSAVPDMTEQGVIVERIVKEAWSPDRQDHVSLAYPKIKGLSSRTIQDQLNTILSKDCVNEYNQASKMLALPTRDFRYELTEDYRVSVNKNSILGIVVDSYEYSGGAHGNPGLSIYTFNTRTGKRYTYDNYFKPNYWPKLKQVLIKNTIDQHDKEFRNAERKELAINYSEYLGTLSDFKKNRFDLFLTETGLVFYISQYTFFGNPTDEIRIPYSEIIGIIDPDGPIGELF